MPADPLIEYFIGDNPVNKVHFLWKKSLPLERKPGWNHGLDKDEIFITYGDYFSAIEFFLKKNSFGIVLSAASDYLKKDITSKDIDKIGIHLEKHGQFYHPARIEVKTGEKKILFVVNCAVSDCGKSCIQREYNVLKRLNNIFILSCLPAVYGFDEITVKEKTKKIIMYLGLWFKGYHEFHISCDYGDQKKRIIVWNNDKENFTLSDRETEELYSQAAEILTFYYNIETFEQIYPWHHAAGDFVLKKTDDAIKLKLISARQYAPMVEAPVESDKRKHSTDSVLEGLLLFFLNLSIRMRLDRLDGTGNIVWSDNIAVQGTVNGFLKGLSLKNSCVQFSDPLDFCFYKTLSSCDEDDLFDLSKLIVDSYSPDAPEIPVIKKKLKEHVHTLYRAVKSKMITVGSYTVPAKKENTFNSVVKHPCTGRLSCGNIQTK